MRSGLGPGSASRVDSVVTPAMTAVLGGRQVHPVLATARMIEWMEWAGRRLILPYLDAAEDAVGYAITVRHLAPTPVGAAFWTIARFQGQDGRKIRAHVEAYSASGLVGDGEFVQVVLDRTELKARFSEGAAP